MMKQPCKHLFNFEEMENSLSECYSKYLKIDDNKTRTQLFLEIKKMAFAILNVGKFWKDLNIDFEIVSYEYSTYLLERIILGTLVPKGITRFPWQQYIRKNIKHIAITKRKEENFWHEMVDDMQFLLDEYSDVDSNLRDETSMDDVIDKTLLTEKLYRAIRIFYSEEDIRRFYPICIGNIDRNFGSYKIKFLPEDVKQFISVVVCCAKRLAAEQNINRSSDISMKEFKKILSSSVRSSVFLSAVVNSDFFNRKLLLSLDIESLYRLVSILGGEEIRIPTLNELDTLLGAVVSVSKIITEGKDPQKVISESKKDCNLIFSRKVNMQYFISKIIESYDIFKENSATNPVINILFSSIVSMEKMLKEFSSKFDPTTSPELLLKVYNEMSDSFNQFTGSLITMNDFISKNKKRSKNGTN